MSIRVQDLRDQTGLMGAKEFLWCFSCLSENSANKGDYFNHPDDHVFKCCEEEMELVRKVVEYIPVDPKDFLVKGEIK